MLIKCCFQSFEEPGADLSSESESAETDRVDVEGDDDTLSLPYSSCSTPTSSGIFRPPTSMVSTAGTRLEYVWYKLTLNKVFVVLYYYVNMLFCFT